MANVKGKFITLTGSQMTILHKDALTFCDNILFEKVGKHWNELDPEAWYDTTILGGFITNYSKASFLGDSAIVVLGKKIYPTIRDTVGLPASIKTAFDLIVFEAQGFILNHQGADVKPRRFIKKEDGHVIVQAPAPGYSQKLYEGVYLGILELFGQKGEVKMTKAAPYYEYEIKW